MNPNKRVSPVIRISRGERDASARATHLEAATRKFLVTTNERKQMSTKTNFKRIALVAAASLGLGLLSSVPSQAVVSGITITGTANGTAGVTATSMTDSLTAATITITAFVDDVDEADSFTVRIVPASAASDAFASVVNLYLTDTGIAGTKVDTDIQGIGTNASADQVIQNQRLLASVSTKADTVGVSAAGVPSGQFIVSRDSTLASATGFIKASFALQVDSRNADANHAPGTYPYAIAVQPYNKGVAGASQVTTLNLVVSRTAAASALIATAASAAGSNLVLSSPGASTTVADNAGTSTTDSSVSVAATASSTNSAYVRVRLRNAASGNAQESITATISAGQIGTAANRGRSVVIAYPAAQVTAGFIDLSITPDGTAGAATINISTPSVTFAPKTITFFSASAKTMTSTVAHPLIAIGANAGAVRTTALDASSVNWAGAAYIYASSAADALIAGSATPVACTWSAADSRHNCPVTGNAVGTAKLKVIDAATVAAATATSNEVTVTVSSATAASVKLSFDKATYAPNERARIYVTPVDSAGKEIPAREFASLLASGGITSNAGFSGSSETLTAVTLTTSAAASSTTGAKAGSAMYTVYMPAAGGTVTITATGGSFLPTAGQVAVTATATVTDSGASALAAVNALATTVASLKTLITTLTNLVLKIQKKVKA